MAVVGLSLLIAAVVSGWLTDKFGPPKPPLLFLSGVLAFAAILIIVLSGRLLAVYAGAAVIGISAGVFFTRRTGLWVHALFRAMKRDNGWGGFLTWLVPVPAR